MCSELNLEPQNEAQLSDQTRFVLFARPLLETLLTLFPTERGSAALAFQAAWFSRSGLPSRLVQAELEQAKSTSK